MQQHLSASRPQVARWYIAHRSAARRPGYVLRLTRAMSLLGYEINSPRRGMGQTPRRGDTVGTIPSGGLL